MTIKELLNKGTIMLKMEQIENPKLKARLLLSHVLDMTRQELIIYDNKTVEKSKEVAYLKNIERLIKGVPLQHITKKQEFMKLNFLVNENVLIPRPDTEILVEEVIKIANKMNKPVILDLCTGSGAIAVSLAKYVKNATVYASDISSKALEVAKENANQNDIDNIKFVESDLFENIEKIKFDIIVTNPPYIRTDVIENLDEEVKKEPLIALDGGKDGLDFYRKIIFQAKEYLKINGYLCFEIGYDQKIDVIELIENEKIYKNTYGKKDLYNNDRILITQKGKFC
jgi:release factor glutamine methyltransferase